MLKLRLALGLILACALLVGDGSAATPPKCCLDAGLTGTWSASTRQLTYTFTAPSGFEASNIVAGTRLGSDGNVVMEAWANVPSSGPSSLGNVGGTLSTYLGWLPRANFYIQLDLICRRVPVSRCTDVNEFNHASSRPALVQVAGSRSGGSGGTQAGATVTFSRTVTVTHADGRTEQTRSAVLVDRDVVAAYGDPVKITIAGGRIAIDRGSQLRYTPTETQRWRLERGTAWFQRTGAEGATAVRGGFAAAEPARGGSFTLTTTTGGDVVRGQGGPATPVWAVGESGRRVSVRPGEQVTVKAGRRFSPVTRSKTPLRPFWR